MSAGLRPDDRVAIRAGRPPRCATNATGPVRLVHVDVKTRPVPDGGGGVPTGRNHGGRGRGIGYDYVHSMVDDHSRLATSEILPDEGPTCAGFHDQAADLLRLGNPLHRRVITDNHLGYRRSLAFANAVTELGAKRLFIRRTAWQNGKPNASARPAEPNGPTGGPSPQTPTRRSPCHKRRTTLNDVTAHSGLPPISRL